MTQMMLLGTVLLIGLIFTCINHPLAMGLILLFQTLLIALLTGLTASSFWFSYILFLVFLGGMLVLFIYVTSLASNEMFSTSSLLWLISFSGLSLVFIISLLFDPLLNIPSADKSVSGSYSNLSEITGLLLKLYSSPTYTLTLLLVLYLFLTLVAVVNVTKISSGPLRPSN